MSIILLVLNFCLHQVGISYAQKSERVKFKSWIVEKVLKPNLGSSEPVSLTEEGAFQWVVLFLKIYFY